MLGKQNIESEAVITDHIETKDQLATIINEDLSVHDSIQKQNHEQSIITTLQCMEPEISQPSLNEI